MIVKEKKMKQLFKRNKGNYLINKTSQFNPKFQLLLEAKIQNEALKMNSIYDNSAAAINGSDFLANDESISGRYHLL